MDGKTFKELVNSKSAVESVKRLRPSSLFIVILVISISLIIRYLFNDVNGYDYMVWIWFVFAIIATAIAIYSYSIDMAAFSKRNSYEKNLS